MRAAIPKAEAEHAFGAVGAELYYAAFHLCQSLYEHVQAGNAFKDWVAPFAGADIGKLGRAEARDLSTMMDLGLVQNSMVHTLLSNYTLPVSAHGDSVVAKVKRAISTGNAAKHLAQRFNQFVPIGAEAMPLKVEFLGAHYSAYFLQISKSERGLEASTGRAHGKLFELQSLKKHFAKQPLVPALDEERPSQFELLVVGDKTNPTQRRAWLQIEMLADNSDLRTRILPDAQAAANTVIAQERAAA